MTIAGAEKATALYPRFKYGTPAVTIDIAEPCIVVPNVPPITGLRGQNRVASGKSETLLGLIEEQVGLDMLCEANQIQALRWALQDSLASGLTFQVWVDRNTGSCWMFENNLKDQNGLALTFNGGGSATYAAGSVGTGVVLSGGKWLTVPLYQASAGTPTGYDDPMLKTEGVLILDFLPAFASNDSTERYLASGDATGSNSWALYKNSINELVFQFTDNAGSSKNIGFSPAPSWSSGNRVQLVASWTSAGALSLFAAVNSGAWTTATVSSGAGTGILTNLPNTLAIGALPAGGSPAPGTYDTVAFYKKAFPSPHMTLAAFWPWRRNYFPYAEITSAVFQPAPMTLSRAVSRWPILIRNGRP